MQRKYDLEDFFNKFSDVLLAFIYAKAVGKLWNFCLVLSPLICVEFNENISLLGALSVNSWLSKRDYALS